jgi:hypothetical protein
MRRKHVRVLERIGQRMYSLTCPCLPVRPASRGDMDDDEEDRREGSGRGPGALRAAPAEPSRVSRKRPAVRGRNHGKGLGRTCARGGRARAPNDGRAHGRPWEPAGVNPGDRAGPGRAPRQPGTDALPMAPTGRHGGSQPPPDVADAPARGRPGGPAQGVAGLARRTAHRGREVPGHGRLPLRADRATKDRGIVVPEPTRAEIRYLPGCDGRPSAIHRNDPSGT